MNKILFSINIHSKIPAVLILSLLIHGTHAIYFLNSTLCKHLNWWNSPFVFLMIIAEIWYVCEYNISCNYYIEKEEIITIPKKSCFPFNRKPMSCLYLKIYSYKLINFLRLFLLMPCNANTKMHRFFCRNKIWSFLLIHCKVLQYHIWRLE